MALFHPHPALRAAMPINPMVDGWMGDDWSHNGAFRQLSLAYWYDQEATRQNKEKWWSDHFIDIYDSPVHDLQYAASFQLRPMV